MQSLFPNARGRSRSPELVPVGEQKEEQHSTRMKGMESEEGVLKCVMLNGSS